LLASVDATRAWCGAWLGLAGFGVHCGAGLSRVREDEPGEHAAQDKGDTKGQGG